MQTPLLLASFTAALLTSSALAQFNISGNSTSAQTINSGTGTVTSTGRIRLSNSNIAVTMDGSSGTLSNSGLIEQIGSARAVRMRNNGTYTITNNLGATIRATSDDAIQAHDSGPGMRITLTNAGTISSTGGQALDFNDIITGQANVTNSGTITATGSDAIRTGTNGIINNSGTIRAEVLKEGTGVSGSDGIDTQTKSGAQITNSGEISGRHGITGGNGTLAYTITVTNEANGEIHAVNGSSINIDGSGSHLILTNRGELTGTYDTVNTPAAGDGDGVDVDGTILLHNYGTIRGLGGNGDNTVEGLAVGGGTIYNYVGAEISGRASVGNVTVANGILVDNSDRGPAHAAAHIDNAGLIRGYSGFGIKVFGAHHNTITNRATGTIQATDVVIETGSGNDVVENSGRIVGANGATAINLGAGDNTLRITGGDASVVGNINGGVGGSNNFVIDPGAGETFSYQGEISNFEEVDIDSGTVIFSGSSVYTGTTTIADDATLVVENSTGSATGSGEVEVLGTLTGSGSVAGDVFIRDGGTLSSTSSQSLNIGGDLSFDSGSRLAFEVGLPIVVNGILQFEDATPILIDLLGNSWTETTYTLLEFDGNSLVDLDQFALGFTPSGYIGTLQLTGSSLNLELQAIPEPTAILWMGASILGGVILHQRRRKQK